MTTSLINMTWCDCSDFSVNLYGEYSVLLGNLRMRGRKPKPVFKARDRNAIMEDYVRLSEAADSPAEGARLMDAGYYNRRVYFHVRKLIEEGHNPLLFAPRIHDVRIATHSALGRGGGSYPVQCDTR